MQKLLILFIITSALTFAAVQLLKKEEKSNFVTVKYRGELGNKLFQTAAAIAYAKDNNLKLILPKKALSSKGFRNMLSGLNFGQVESSNIIKELSSPYIYHPLPQKINCCLEGFFISEKYFYKYRKEVISHFSMTRKLKLILQRKHPKIFKHKCTVALHIRTFLKDLGSLNEKFYEIYPRPDLEYVKKAISNFPSDALFVVCSDNIPCCRKFLKDIPSNFYFVEGQKNFEDLYLMSLCKHMITSNSTFSWWAAYLNENPNKKIITRSPWIMKIESKMEDIVPKDWVIIEGAKNPKVLTF